MSEVKTKEKDIYVAIDADLYDLLDKLKAFGLEKSKVVNYALRRLTAMEFSQFLEEVLVPEAKRLDIVKMFKAEKEEVPKE